MSRDGLTHDGLVEWWRRGWLDGARSLPSLSDIPEYLDGYAFGRSASMRSRLESYHRVDAMDAANERGGTQP